MNEWEHKDIWKKRGDNFAIEVSRHTGWRAPDTNDAPTDVEHRWCVYAYIYPKHPHFAAFTDETLFQPAAVALNMHGYPSYVQKHISAEGVCTSWQVGADYSHLHDTRFSTYATQEDAWEVFGDADDLHALLTRMGAATV
jgi:hypothetical protein